MEPFETPDSVQQPSPGSGSGLKKYGLLIAGVAVVIAFGVLAYFFFTYSPSPS